MLATPEELKQQLLGARTELQKRAAEAGVNPKDLVGMTKPPVALVPPCLEIYASMAMKNGAVKYGPYNWRDQKVQAMQYLSAMKRHIDAFIDGEENAKDSGVHHLAHVAAGCGILLDAFLCDSVVDDRPKPGKTAELIEKLTEKANELPKV